MSEEVKQPILSKIFISNYREVMKCILEGHSREEVAEMCHYSTKQVNRIVTLCWKEVCILLAEDIVGKTVTLYIDEATRKHMIEELCKR